jgi:hypothetical protein
MNSYLFQRFNFIHLAIFYPLLINILTTVFDANSHDEIILVVKTIVGWQFVAIGIYSLIIDRNLVRAPLDAQVFATCGICIMSIIQIFGRHFDNFNLNAHTISNIALVTFATSFIVGSLSVASPTTAIGISRFLFGSAIASFFGQFFRFKLSESVVYVPLIGLIISTSDIPIIDITLCSTSYIYSQMIVDGIQLIIREVVIDGVRYVIFEKDIALVIIAILIFIGRSINIEYIINRNAEASNIQSNSNPPSYSTFNSSPNAYV